ncbi:MAG: multidrug efflux SMR transporter [Mycobacteriaceae bacterium]
MAWVVLVLSGAMEAVWATALGRSDGFSRLVPVLIFVVAVTASMGGLAYALREIPVGTGYAVWVGIGAALTVAYAMVTGEQPVSVLRVLLLAGLVGCVIGLRVVG